MTYEDLLVAIANEAPNLSKCAIGVLLRLVATAIETGSPDLRLSHNWLSERTGLSREGVARGTRELAHIIGVGVSNGVSTSYSLPAEWFAPQRSLFAVDSRLGERFNLPNPQAGSGQLSRQVPANVPGSTGQISRQERPTFQAPPANGFGIPANTPGRSGQDSRQVSTQNQQLSDASLDRSNRVLPALEPLHGLRDSIESVTQLPVAFREDAETLKRWLRDFYETHHPSHRPPEGPDESIQAKCLAIAPLRRLAGILATRDKKGTRPGESWAWFVTVFANSVHGTKVLADVPAPPEFRKTLKPPSTESGTLFPNSLLKQAAASVHTMR